MSFNELWGQNDIYFIILVAIIWACMQIIIFLAEFFHLTVFWPVLTFNDLEGQNIIVNYTQGYHIVIYGKNASLGVFFNVYLFLTCFDLDLYWPLMTFEVRMRLFIILIGIVLVCNKNIEVIGVFSNIYLFLPCIDLL